MSRNNTAKIHVEEKTKCVVVVVAAVVVVVG
jgi:hypothetical protein